MSARVLDHSGVTRKWGLKHPTIFLKVRIFPIRQKIIMEYNLSLQTTAYGKRESKAEKADSSSSLPFLYSAIGFFIIFSGI